jgi:hypothetical protein
MAAPTPIPDPSAAPPRATPPTLAGPSEPDSADRTDAVPPDDTAPPPDPDALADDALRELPRLQHLVHSLRLAPQGRLTRLPADPRAAPSPTRTRTWNKPVDSRQNLGRVSRMAFVSNSSRLPTVVA